MFEKALLPCLLAALALSGCAKAPNLTTGMPEKPPSSNESQYGPVLECLDHMMKTVAKRKTDLLVAGFRDGTRPPNVIDAGFLSEAGERMARTSLARMAPTISVITPQSIMPGRTTVVLMGEFTELDRVSPSSGWAGSLRLGPVEIELNTDRTWDIMALDVELMEINGRQLPGQAVSVAAIIDSETSEGNIVVANSDGKIAASAAGQYKSVGRRHGTQRLLIDVGIYTLLSHYYKLDADACLRGGGIVEEKGAISQVSDKTTFGSGQSDKAANPANPPQPRRNDVMKNDGAPGISCAVRKLEDIVHETFGTMSNRRSQTSSACP